MSDAVNEFRHSIRRRAVAMEIGGFRPSESLAHSWFGRVNLALPDEAWPYANDRPMLALCQINLTELPFCPPRLNDLELITVFIDAEELPTDDPNGTNWCLRAYPSLQGLVPLTPQGEGSPIKPLPMRPVAADEDFPCWEDVTSEVPAEVENSYYDHFPNVPGFKLGGWPSLIQSEIYWAPWQKHPIAPEYVFQIGSTEKGHWMWGDNGVGYFGRGTASGHEHEWALGWQCY